MLKEAVEAKRNDQPVEEKSSLEIDVEVDAYIPDAYIADGHQKIEMYKRFRGITSLEEVEELQDEMLDLFGEYPDEVAYLFLIAEMKVYAEKAGIESIKQLKQEISILLREKVSSGVDGQKVFELGSKYGRMVGFGMDGNRMKLVLHMFMILREICM